MVKVAFETPVETMRWLATQLTLKPAVVAALEEYEPTGADLRAFTDQGEWETILPGKGAFGARCQIQRLVATTQDAHDSATHAASQPTHQHAAGPSEEPRTLSSYAFLLDLPHVWTEGITVASEGLPGWQLWDFAGQLEYYPAHQFFLSSARAVTVLVTDASAGRQQCAARLSTTRGRSSDLILCPKALIAGMAHGLQPSSRRPVADGRGFWMIGVSAIRRQRPRVLVKLPNGRAMAETTLASRGERCATTGDSTSVNNQSNSLSHFRQ